VDGSEGFKVNFKGDVVRHSNVSAVDTQPLLEFSAGSKQNEKNELFLCLVACFLFFFMFFFLKQQHNTTVEQANLAGARRTLLNPAE
jgi:hypothetical protein